jgi:drug/metabolite transporter (DMT)-like permease
MKVNELTLSLVIGLSIGIISVLTKILVNTTKSHPIEIIITRYSISIIIALLFLTFILNRNIKQALYSFKLKDFVLCILISVIIIFTSWGTFLLLKSQPNTIIVPLNACLGLLFAVLLSFIFLQEKISYSKLIGIIILMFGFCIIVKEDKDKGMTSLIQF